MGGGGEKNRLYIRPVARISQRRRGLIRGKVDLKPEVGGGGSHLGKCGPLYYTLCSGVARGAGGGARPPGASLGGGASPASAP